VTASAPTPSRVAQVQAIPLRAPTDAASLDGSSETILVLVHDEDGRVGIGEADAPAAAVQSLVTMQDAHAWSRGLTGALLGRDPFELAAIHDDLYQATIYHGRRGLGVHAISAVDIALHDLVGKQLGRPVYQLLGGARREAISPYATIYAGSEAGRTARDYMDDLARRCESALALGFHAVKVEPLFGGLATDRELVDYVRESRRVLGGDVTMMADFGYRWHDWRAALWTLSRLEDVDLYFAEATLQHDDLDGHRKLAERVETRVGGAELAATVHECREWLERAGVDVLQPDINRCGGLTEIRRIAELATHYGALVIPHCWKTGVTAAAARHFQAATANAPWVEMLHPALYESPLRAELTRPEPVIVDGWIPLPREPGLGIELVPEALERYAVTAS
jgi:L-alanine-DL-glutamate epimerase-like enolase superfamily enzyme